MKKLFILTGASGVGKTTVSHYLLQKYHIPAIITHTTRPQRPGEIDGIDYYFETPTSFAQNNYLEQVKYADYWYGSSIESLNKSWSQNEWVSIVLDTAGALTYQRHYPQETVVIFLTSDVQELYQRLQQRSVDHKALKQRLNSPEFQRDLHLPAALQKQAYVINNDNWLQTQKQLDQLIQQLKTRSHREKIDN